MNILYILEYRIRKIYRYLLEDIQITDDYFWDILKSLENKEYYKIFINRIWYIITM